MQLKRVARDLIGSESLLRVACMTEHPDCGYFLGKRLGLEQRVEDDDERRRKITYVEA
jgi:hypothetical protein